VADERDELRKKTTAREAWTIRTARVGGASSGRRGFLAQGLSLPGSRSDGVAWAFHQCHDHLVRRAQDGDDDLNLRVRLFEAVAFPLCVTRRLAAGPPPPTRDGKLTTRARRCCVGISPRPCLSGPIRERGKRGLSEAVAGGGGKKIPLKRRRPFDPAELTAVATRILRDVDGDAGTTWGLLR
jgi:hypothetical protein